MSHGLTEKQKEFLQHRMSQEAKIPCPNDGTIMNKQLAQGSVIIDRCSSCKGIWLDQGELERLTTRLMAKDGINVSPGLEQELQVLAEASAASLPGKPCPHHGTLMTKVLCGPAILDRCESCKGIWLDSNELSAIQNVVYQRSSSGAMVRRADDDIRAELAPPKSASTGNSALNVVVATVGGVVYAAGAVLEVTFMVIGVVGAIADIFD